MPACLATHPLFQLFVRACLFEVHPSILWKPHTNPARLLWEANSKDAPELCLFLPLIILSIFSRTADPKASCKRKVEMSCFPPY